MISLVQFGIVVFVALGSVTYGYGSAIIATTLGQPTFLSYFGLDTASNSAAIIGAINGLFSVGGFIGCMTCIWVADYLGRRKAILTGAVLAIVGAGLQAGSVHIAMFIVARCLTGVAVGMLVCLVPLFQVEIAPPKIRGFLVGMHGTAIALGYAISSWTGFGFYHVNANAAQWRLPLAIASLPAIGLAVGVMFVPESPRWLLLKDHPDKAFKSFKDCRTESADEGDDVAIQEEFNMLYLKVAEEIRTHGTWKDIFVLKPLRKRVLVSVFVMVSAQATGCLVIGNYSALIYSRLGLDSTMQILLNAVWLCIGPPGNFLNASLVDKIGRIRMLTFGICGCISALIGECVSLAKFQATGNEAAAKVAIFFVFFHLLFYSTCVDATTYIYAAEVFPNPVRAKGMSIAIGAMFLVSLILLTVAGTAFTKIGWKYFLVFAILSSVCVIVVALFLPETKGLALEDIAEIFGDNINLSEDLVKDITEEATKGECSVEELEETMQGTKNVVKDHVMHVH